MGWGVVSEGALWGVSEGALVRNKKTANNFQLKKKQTKKNKNTHTLSGAVCVVPIMYDEDDSHFILFTVKIRFDSSYEFPT